jgi:hypothetical protein
MLLKSGRPVGRSSFVLGLMCCVLFGGAMVLLARAGSPPSLENELSQTRTIYDKACLPCATSMLC